MRIGKLEISPGFLLLAAWLNYVDRHGLFLPGLVCCVLHEMGHLVALFLLKKSVKSIRLTAVGAEIRLERSLDYRGELFASLMGPAVNLMLALILCRVSGGAAVAGINLILACFNLLPIGQMDGGRVVRCVLSMVLGPEWGDRGAEWLSRALVLVVCVAGLAVLSVGGNVTLLLAVLWLLKGNWEKRLKIGRKSRK